MAADSVCLGCLYDFRARGEEPEVVVTHVRLGGAAWAHRLHLDVIGRWLLRTAGELDLPWEAIAAVETRVS
jgi:hypothetical protein